MAKDKDDSYKIWLERENFELPLSYHLFADAKKAPAALKLLDIFDLRVVETNHLPFFDLLPK